MASINTSSNCRHRRGQAGFTLVEALMGMTIGSIIMAGVLSTYIMTGREFRALSNYWEIHADGRNAIDRFAIDMRAVYGIASFSTNGSIVVKMPYFAGNGTITNTSNITYTYANSMLKRTDGNSGKTSVLATNIYNLKFSLYDRVGNTTTVLSSAKGISIELFLRKFTAGQKQTEDYLSARINMRNVP
jgi:prepilin-type N-terminal cleavage/methylation domain-containing protein